MKNRRRNLLMLLLLSMASLPATAQTFSAGIIGGVSTGTVKITDIKQGFTDVMEGENIFGYEGGIFVKLRLFPLYIKPQLLYSAREGEIKYIQKPTSESLSISRTSDFRIERFEAPLLLGFNIVGPFLSLEAGPVYHYLVTNTENYNGNELDMEKNGLGYRAGVSSELGPLVLNVSYQGLASIIGTDKANYKEPYKIIFGLGLILGETR